MKHIGLCNRHEMYQNNGTPITGFIFPKDVAEPLNFKHHYGVAFDYLLRPGHANEITLYVTGLTPLLTATLLAAKAVGIETLKVMHFNRDTEKWVAQDVSALLTFKKVL